MARLVLYVMYVLYAILVPLGLNFSVTSRMSAMYTGTAVYHKLN